MKVALVYAGRDREDQKVKQIASSLSSALSKKYEVTLLNAYVDEERLTFYDFIVLVSTQSSFISARIPDIVPKYLKTTPGAEGKRSLAVVLSGIRSSKTTINLMKAMEEQGMLVNASFTVKNASEAGSLGKNIQLERS